MVRDSSIHPERHAVSDIIRNIIDMIEITQVATNARSIASNSFKACLAPRSILDRFEWISIAWMDGWMAVVPS